MANKSSQHILNTSATLLGFCLFVITSLHSSKYSATSLIDEFTSVVALLLIFSCMCSFYSIQTVHPNIEKRTEKIAELLFAFSLVGILIIVTLLLLDIIQ